MWTASKEMDQSLAEDAVACFMQAIKLNSRHSHQLVAVVLWLLCREDMTQKLGSLFETSCLQIPMWVWLDWVPELLETLSRPAGKHTKPLLILFAKVHPHSLLYPLRTKLLQMDNPILSTSATGPLRRYKLNPLPKEPPVPQLMKREGDSNWIRQNF